MSLWVTAVGTKHKYIPTPVFVFGNPQSGCKISNLCDVETGIMLQSKLVKTVTEQEERLENEGDNSKKEVAYNNMEPILYWK